METTLLIEAILFHLAEPISAKELARLLKKPIDDIRSALNTLNDNLQHRGIRLISNNDTYTLVTAPEASAIITDITKEELSKDLSKAAIETLAIVVYRAPVTRSEIDYIRGVNSTFILRNLLIRGLVEKIENPEDQRSFLYRPTLELLKHLGITSITEMPEHELVLSKIASFSEMATPSDTLSTDSVQRPTEQKTPEPIDMGSSHEEETDIVEEDLAGAEYVDPALQEEQHDIEEKTSP